MPQTAPRSVALKVPDGALKDTEAQIDMAALRGYRLDRVREQLQQLDYGACVLFDPINIRYATGTRNMQVWTQHAPERYAFVPAQGPVVLVTSEGAELLFTFPYEDDLPA